MFASRAEIRCFPPFGLAVVLSIAYNSYSTRKRNSRGLCTAYADQVSMRALCGILLISVHSVQKLVSKTKNFCATFCKFVVFIFQPQDVVFFDPKTAQIAHFNTTSCGFPKFAFYIGLCYTVDTLSNTAQRTAPPCVACVTCCVATATCTL